DAGNGRRVTARPGRRAPAGSGCAGRRFLPRSGPARRGASRSPAPPAAGAPADHTCEEHRSGKRGTPLEAAAARPTPPGGSGGDGTRADEHEFGVGTAGRVGVDPPRREAGAAAGVGVPGAAAGDDVPTDSPDGAARPEPEAVSGGAAAPAAGDGGGKQPGGRAGRNLPAAIAVGVALGAVTL